MRGWSGRHPVKSCAFSAMHHRLAFGLPPDGIDGLREQSIPRHKPKSKPRRFDSDCPSLLGMERRVCPLLIRTDATCRCFEPTSVQRFNERRAPGL